MLENYLSLEKKEESRIDAVSAITATVRLPTTSWPVTASASSPSRRIVVCLKPRRDLLVSGNTLKIMVMQNL